jgi:hypothetical protein
MGVLELIQQKAFIGKEFLTWLWFRSERDKEIKVGRGNPIDIEILGPILLDAQYGDARASMLKGDSPATAPEAGTALLEGKKLKKAKMKWVREDVEWIFSMDGETFNISGLGIPNPGKLPFEDLMTMRVDMVLEFEQALQDLLETFMELRLDEKPWAQELKEIQKWVAEK